MFRQFAHLVSPDLLLEAHPIELAWLLEEVWRQRLNDTNKSLGDPARRSDLNAMPPLTSTWPPLSAGLLPILTVDAGG